jgi:Ran GTPase-activating protein (RanGAP) involved in mRNA processing and transport
VVCKCIKLSRVELNDEIFFNTLIYILSNGILDTLQLKSFLSNHSGVGNNGCAGASFAVFKVTVSPSLSSYEGIDTFLSLTKHVHALLPALRSS